MNAEAARIRKLYQTELLDTPSEKAFDEIVHLASQLAHTPISLITLLDTDRQWFKAKAGLDSSYTDRSSAVCNYTIQSDHLFEVEDLSADSRFTGNKLVTSGPKLRYYAGMPLTTSDGYRIGALCVLDTKSRVKLDQDQVFALKVLANQAMNQIELRVKNKEMKSQRAITEKLMGIAGPDLRDMITNIRQGISDVSGSFLDDPAIAAGLDRMQHSLNLNEHTANNIIGWSKVLASGANDMAEDTLLVPVIAECIADLAQYAQQKGNEIVNEVPENASLPVNSHSLRFIIRNLLHNSIKYSDNGKIAIRYFTSGGNVTSSQRKYLSVADAGIGISADDQQAFINGGDLTQRNGTIGEKGSGLGLMLIRNLLLKAGGKLHIEGGANCSAIIIM